MEHKDFEPPHQDVLRKLGEAVLIAVVITIMIAIYTLATAS